MSPKLEDLREQYAKEAPPKYEPVDAVFLPLVTSESEVFTARARSLVFSPPSSQFRDTSGFDVSGLSPSGWVGHIMVHGKCFGCDASPHSFAVVEEHRDRDMIARMELLTIVYSWKCALFSCATASAVQKVAVTYELAAENLLNFMGAGIRPSSRVAPGRIYMEAPRDSKHINTYQGKRIVGIDVGESGDDTTLTVMMLNASGVASIVDSRTYKASPGASAGRGKCLMCSKLIEEREDRAVVLVDSNSEFGVCRKCGIVVKHSEAP